MALLGRDQILKADDVETRDVECPEWGGTVRVRPLTAAQRSRIESIMLEVNQTKRGYERVGQVALKCVAWCTVGEDGKPIFEESDVKELGGKNSAPILRIRDAVFELSGLHKTAVEEEVEDFSETPDGSSSTD